MQTTGTDAATEFFTRHRTAAEIHALRVELPENRLQLATQEALASKYDQRRREQREAAKRVAFQQRADAETRRVQVDPDARAMLPAPGVRSHRRHSIRPIRRFWADIAGADLRHELVGYARFRDAERAKATAAVMQRWNNAPLDPITPEEYAAVTTKSRAGRRAARERQARARAMRAGNLIAPAGITLETAERIAYHVLDRPRK